MTRGPESGWAAGPRASPLPVHLPGVGEGGGVARHSEFGRARPTVRGTWPIGWRPGSAWRALRGVGDEAGPAAGPAELAEAEAGDRPSARRDVPGRRLRPDSRRGTHTERACAQARPAATPSRAHWPGDDYRGQARTPPGSRTGAQTTARCPDMTTPPEGARGRSAGDSEAAESARQARPRRLGVAVSATGLPAGGAGSRAGTRSHFTCAGPAGRQ